MWFGIVPLDEHNLFSCAQVRYSRNHDFLRTIGFLAVLAAVLYSAFLGLILNGHCWNQNMYYMAAIWGVTRFEIHAVVDCCSSHRHVQAGFFWLLGSAILKVEKVDHYLSQKKQKRRTTGLYSGLQYLWAAISLGYHIYNLWVKVSMGLNDINPQRWLWLHHVDDLLASCSSFDGTNNMFLMDRHGPLLTR